MLNQTKHLTLTPEELAAVCANIDATALSNYSPGMLAALKKLDREPDANNYELFIINGTANGVKGFMPLNRSAGFIFTGNQSAAEVQQTIAHELGHGAFGLEHVGTAAGKTATDNLMDYTASTALDKPQWDLIHGEHRRLTWFQGEEEGMYFDYSRLDLSDKIIIENALLVLRQNSSIYSSIIDESNGRSEKLMFAKKSEEEKKLISDGAGTLVGYENNVISRFIFNEKYYFRIGLDPFVFEDKQTLQTALAEELFHYCQGYYYGRKICKTRLESNDIIETVVINANYLQTEVEAKLLRYYTNTYCQFESYWIDYAKSQDSIIQTYLDCIKNSKPVSQLLLDNFTKVVETIASNLKVQYKEVTQEDFDSYKNSGFQIPCLKDYIRRR